MIRRQKKGEEAKKKLQHSTITIGRIIIDSVSIHDPINSIQFACTALDFG